MPEHPIVSPLRHRLPVSETHRRAKCDRDVKLHLPESLYDDLVRLAHADHRATGEYLRVVLERHVYGVLAR